MPSSRTNLSSSSFVHLDVRSCFSLKEGAFTPEQLAMEASAARHASRGHDRPRRALRRRPIRAGVRGLDVRPILGASITVRAGAGGKSGGKPRPTMSCCSRPTTPDTRTCAGCSPTRTCSASAAIRGSIRCRSARTPQGSSRSPVPRRIRAGRRSQGRVDHAARLLDPFREAFGRDRLLVGVEHRLERASTERDPRDAAARRPRRGARRRDESRALPRSRRRVRGRRARVHAAPGAARRDERHAPQRRGLVEAARRDARALRRASRSVRRDPRRRRHVPVRPRARAHPLPRLPDAAGAQRRRRARRAMLARRARARDARRRAPARPSAPRALDDPAAWASRRTSSPWPTSSPT